MSSAFISACSGLDDVGFVRVAVLRTRAALDQFHHEVRTAVVCRFGEELHVRKEGLPDKYHANSTLTAEIKPGNNVTDFRLEK